MLFLSSDQQGKRREILNQLLGTCHPLTGIEPDFHCDYGFNIHTHGLVVINYNCVTIGAGSVIGAGSTVIHDIPEGVVAAGTPCRVIRKITEKDKISQDKIIF